MQKFISMKLTTSMGSIAMTKEIMKFRAWDGLNKKFTYWTMNDLCTWDEKSEKPSALDDWTPYTGLKDKNNKEIFEGDIVKFGTLVGEIKYTRAEFYCRFVGGLIPSNGMAWHWEVIGNIYQNPELLQ